ncbi:MAG: leucine-rich repeat protein [Ruminococcus sp.]|nr:leucine-rich repeat protein [Ruminococcus sp.]
MYNLTAVHLGKNVTKLPDACLYDCGSLSNVNLENVKEYGEGALSGCTSLEKEIYIDDTVVVKEGAFSGSSITLYVEDESNLDYRIGVPKLVYCYSTSQVYQYCKENNVPYVLIDSASVKELKDCTVSVDDVSYTGSELKPAVTVKDSNGKLVSPKYYTVVYNKNVEPGKGTVTVTGDGTNVLGTASATFNIGYADIANASITLDCYSYEYSGTSCRPEPTIYFNGKKLEYFTDYTYGYSDNINAGTATITIDGWGEYFDGEVDIPFEITPKDMSEATISGFYDKLYLGGNQNVYLTLDGKKLSSTTAYSISYTNNTTPGIATMTFTGKGNYTGTIKKNYSIYADFADENMSVSVDNASYTGTAVSPNVTVKCNGNQLTKDKDYSVTFSNNVSVGTANYTITGKGYYEGTITGTFKITAPFLPGDLTGEGKVNMRDYAMLQRYLLDPSGVRINTAAADLNGDKKVNMRDYALLQKLLLKPAAK